MGIPASVRRGGSMGNWDVMNPPQEPDTQAYVDWYRSERWVFCPYCGKRQFPITPNAVIRGQQFQCKGSNCKKHFEVNYG